MELNYDFRYKNTLRINFEDIVGVGSNGFESQEEYDAIKEIAKLSNGDIHKLNSITDVVNNIVIKHLGHVELDWRDDQELEIHQVFDKTNVENLIDELKNFDYGKFMR